MITPKQYSNLFFVKLQTKTRAQDISSVQEPIPAQGTISYQYKSIDAQIRSLDTPIT